MEEERKLTEKELKQVKVLAIIVSGILIGIVIYAVILAVQSVMDKKADGGGSENTEYYEQVQSLRDEDISLYEDTMSEEEDSATQGNNNFEVINSEEFDNMNLDTYAVMAFYICMQDYLNDEFGEDESYHISIIKDSFKDDDQFPRFYATISEKPDVTIKCNYHRKAEIYTFNLYQQGAE